MLRKKYWKIFSVLIQKKKKDKKEIKNTISYKLTFVDSTKLISLLSFAENIAEGIYEINRKYGHEKKVWDSRKSTRN